MTVNLVTTKFTVIGKLVMYIFYDDLTTHNGTSK